MVYLCRRDREALRLRVSKGCNLTHLIEDVEEFRLILWCHTQDDLHQILAGVWDCNCGGVILPCHGYSFPGMGGGEEDAEQLYQSRDIPPLHEAGFKICRSSKGNPRG